MQHDSGHGGGLTLASRAVRHHVVLVLLLLVVGTAVGAYAAFGRPAAFTSVAHVLINPSEGNAYAPSRDNDELTSLETEAQLVGSDAVLATAADLTARDESLATLEDGLQVSVPTNTQTLQISFTAADPEVAQDSAQALATSYLEVRGERAEEVVAGQLTMIEAQTERVIADLREATAKSERGNAERRAFQARLADALSSELVSLRTQRTALETTMPRPGSIYSPAGLPPERSPLIDAALVAAGALVGLILGLSLALLRERQQGLVRTQRDVEANGVTVLASLPRLTTSTRGRSSAAAQRALDEGVARLRSFVLGHGEQARTIAVHEGVDGEGAPSLGRALAASLARAGYSVVLVAGGGGGQQSRSDGAGLAERGFTDLLRGQSRVTDELLRPCGDAGFHLLPAGTNGQGVDDLFVPTRLAAVIDPLRERHDFVVLEAPSPLVPRGEAIANASAMSIAVLVSGSSKAARLRDFAAAAQRNQTLAAAAVVAGRGSHAELRDPCAPDPRAHRHPQGAGPTAGDQTGARAHHGR